MRFLTLLSLLLGSTFVCGQCQKTLHTILPAQDILHVSLNIKTNNTKVEIKSTKGTRILVETTVEMSIDNPNLLEFAITTDRYTLKQELDKEQQTLVLFALENNNVLVAKGQEVKETITHTIFIPEGINAVDLGQPQTAMSAPPVRD